MMASFENIQQTASILYPFALISTLFRNKTILTAVTTFEQIVLVSTLVHPFTPMAHIDISEISANFY